MNAPPGTRRLATAIAVSSVLGVLLAPAVSHAEPFDPDRCLGFPRASLAGPIAVDLDGDGLSEVLVTQSYMVDPFHPPVAYLYVYHANGLWTFDQPVIYATVSYPQATVAGDIDRDGRPDVAVGSPASATVDLFRNVGGATLTHVGSVSSSPGDPKLLVDLDGDGNLDLVSADATDSNIGVALGHGDFTFGPRTAYAGPGTFNAVAAGDITGDGLKDLVVASASASFVRVLIGQPNGTFVAGTDLQLGAAVHSVALGRLDADDILDLAVGVGSGGLATFQGNGDGTFGGRLDYPATSDPTGVVIGEFDGDAHNDVAAIGSNGHQVTLWHGVGDGTLVNSLPYGGTGFSLQAIDVNHDGRLDLVSGGSTGACALVRSQGAVTSVPGPDRTGPALELTAVAPNPSRHGWWVSFALPAEGRVTLALLDLAGRRLESRALGTLAAGDHQVRFEPAQDVAPGVYWLRLESASGRPVSRPCVVR